MAHIIYYSTANNSFSKTVFCCCNLNLALSKNFMIIVEYTICINRGPFLSWSFPWIYCIIGALWSIIRWIIVVCPDIQPYNVDSIFNLRCNDKIPVSTHNAKVDVFLYVSEYGLKSGKSLINLQHVQPNKLPKTFELTSLAVGKFNCEPQISAKNFWKRRTPPSDQYFRLGLSRAETVGDPQTLYKIKFDKLILGRQ